MKNTLKNIALMFALTLGCAVAANAQAITSGTVDFSVAVPEAFDLRSNGTVTGVGITNSPAQSANTMLGVVLSVADASPNIDNSALTAAVPIRMRSNRSYRLQAARQTADAVSAQDFDSSDIGMSLSTPVRSGAQVNAGGDTIIAPYTVGGGGNVGGLATGLSGGTTIVNGDRISNQGDNNSSDNFATATLNFSIARQYYTPTAGTPFTQKVTVSISAQP